MHQVMIHPATYETAHASVDRAFDLFPQDLEGKKVLIKPNVLRASEASEGIVTHPAVLAAVVDKVETLGPAALVVGDNPGLFSYGANEAAFEQTGLMAAARGYYRNIGLDAVIVPFNPHFMETVSVSRAILEADIVISLPKFKTHGLTVMTGAIKNSYGFLPGAQKARLHKIAGSPARFHDLVVEVFKIRVPGLFIVDAVVGMEGNGPASPDLREIGLILASDNAVALDAVMAVMMGLDSGRLRFLQNAADAGLGSWKMTDIRIDGKLEKMNDFKLPPLGGEAIQDNAAVQEMLQSKTLLIPQPDPDACTACGACVEQCPAQALSMPDNLPQVDMERCVTCFCCQEICPEKAMVLQ
ncbi:MAG: DUF362 domain-containing protein [Desulfosarcina sp.]|nr:DUF362 domain-containing protein [Desulfosarcina sp.]MBC2742797.1 DUF362 domain-containing protein [Desulfosarcina sp.]MBC2765707.1 DUF362 domain-containing protein [Desulfosarcina sp.]